MLVFDAFENLKYTIRYTEGPKQSVTSIDCSFDEPDYPTLAVGFSGGHIAIYDIKTFSCIKAITDTQTCKITSLKIYNPSNPLRFIGCDESGEIYSYQVQKMLWIYKEQHTQLMKDSDRFVMDLQTLSKDMAVINSKTLTEQEQLKNILFIAKTDVVIVINYNRRSDNSYSVVPEWVFERPKGVPVEIHPTIALGNSSFSGNKLKTYLTIAWGPIVYLHTFAYDGLRVYLTEVGYFSIKNNAQFVSWIADDTIITIDNQNTVCLINLDEFTLGKYESGEPLEISTDSTNPPSAKPDENTLTLTSSISSPTRLDESPGHQSSPLTPPKRTKEGAFMYKLTLEKGLKPNVTFTHKRVLWRSTVNSASVLQVSHQMLMITEDKVLKIKIVSALEYLDSLLFYKEWLKFLTIGLQIYHLNIREFHGVPLDPKRRRNLFVPFFEERITKYLNEQLKNHIQNEAYYKEFVLSLIDFLFEIQDTDFLFNFVFRKLSEVDLQKQLISALEPLILLNKIDSIPSEQLRSVIIHFCSIGKSSLVQKLIYSLDLSQQEPFNLIHLCLEHDLYSALIYVCTNTDENFITPFVKHINDYKSAKKNKNEEEAQKYGYRCLWILKLCIEKKIIPEEMDKSLEKWKTIMLQLMVMIFEPENLKILYEIDGGLTTCFVMLFFIGDLAQLAQENYGNLQLGNRKSSEGHINDNIHFQIYTVVRDVLKNWQGSENKTLYDQFFGFFLGILAHILRYPFLDPDLCIYFAELYIYQPTLLSEKLLVLWEKTRLTKEGKTTQEIEQYFEENVNYDFIIEQRIGIILDLLKYCQFTIKKQQVDELIKKAQASNL